MLKEKLKRDILDLYEFKSVGKVTGIHKSYRPRWKDFVLDLCLKFLIKAAIVSSQ